MFSRKWDYAGPPPFPWDEFVPPVIGIVVTLGLLAWAIKKAPAPNHDDARKARERDDRERRDREERERWQAEDDRRRNEGYECRICGQTDRGCTPNWQYGGGCYSQTT